MIFFDAETIFFQIITIVINLETKVKIYKRKMQEFGNQRNFDVISMAIKLFFCIKRPAGMFVFIYLLLVA